MFSCDCLDGNFVVIFYSRNPPLDTEKWLLFSLNFTMTRLRCPLVPPKVLRAFKQ